MPASTCKMMHATGNMDGSVIMHRRLNKFLLIGLVAAWAQIFAPLMPYLVVASADPIATAEICSSMADGQGHRSGQTPGSPACILHCAFAHATFAVLGSPESTASLPIRYVAGRTVWAEHQSHDRFARHRTPAQARAPPLFS